MGIHTCRRTKSAYQRRNLSLVQATHASAAQNAAQKCCRHVVSTKTFQSNKTREIFQIRHKLNCPSRNVIYLGYCTLCQKSQYVGKSEPPVNLRINTHRYDVTSPNGGAFDKHFNKSDHNYNENARFILIEQMRVPENATKLMIRQLLEDREDYWILRPR